MYKLPVNLPSLPLPDAPDGDGDDYVLVIDRGFFGDLVGKVVQKSWPFQVVDVFHHTTEIGIIHEVSREYPQITFDPEDNTMPGEEE